MHVHSAYTLRSLAAYWFASASRETVRISNEQGNPARVIQSGSGPHDQVLATIKRMPFPLNNREFVGRVVCAKDTNGDLLITAVPVDDVVDFGLSTRTVRAVSRALSRFTPYGESQCKVTLILYLDAGGVIPTRVVESKIPLALSAVGDLRDEFQRDDEIDKMERDELARVIKDEQQVYSEDEDSLIQRVQDKLGALKEEDFEELESPDYLVKMKLNTMGAAGGVGRATTVVDASIEVCAAWEMAKMSREQLKKPSLWKTLTAVNSHNHVYHTVCDYVNAPGFLPREFVVRQVWQHQDAEKLVVIYESFEHADYPMRSEYVRGSSMTCSAYVQLPTVAGVPQTRVTSTSEIDMGGNLPRIAQKIGTLRFLRSLSATRNRFDKSPEIDGATRALNVGLIADHVEQYSEEENALLEEGEKHFAVFKEMKAKSLRMSSPLTTGEIAFKKKDSHAWGRATTTVRTRPEEVLAFLWDTMRRSARREDDLEKGVEEQVNRHNMLVYNKKRTPKIIADRDFLGRVVWKKEGEGFVLVTCPEKSEARPITGGVVRGKYPSTMKIKRKNDKETTLEYVIQIDFGGSLRTWLTNAYVGLNLRRVTAIQEYFLELRKMEDYDADDGKVLGVRLMHPGGENGKKPWQKVRDVVEKHRSLEKLSVEFDWLVGFLEEVVRGKWVTSGSVSTKLECLSEKEARKIGRSLMPALKQRKTVVAGLHQWKMQNRSMVELFERYDWVESMVLEVAQEVMKTAPWGLMWRVCTGAALSVLDIVTDVVVILVYTGNEETRGYGYSLLGMLVGSMVLQLMIVFLQNRKKPWAMAKEMLVVITGLKAPW